MAENNKKKLLPKKPNMGFNQFWIFGILGVVFLWMVLQSKTDQEEISGNKFREIALSGHVEKLHIKHYSGGSNVAEIYIREEVLKKDSTYKAFTDGKKKLMEKGPHFTYQVGNLESFTGEYQSYQDQLVKKGLYEFDVKNVEGQDVWGGLFNWLPLILIIVIFFFLMRRMSGGGGPGGQIFNISKSKAALFDAQSKVKTSFHTVVL